jgi:cytochrome c-type biogenesis protein CcmH
MQGAPDTPGQPLASRTDLEPAPAHDFDALLAKLAQHLAEDPADVDGWALLGQSYGALGRYPESAEAYGRAFALRGEDAKLASAYGEALVLAADGIVGEDARRAIAVALAANPADPRARFFDGLAKEQEGDTQGAFDMLLALAKDSPADAPWQDALRARLQALAAKLGIEPPTIATAPAAEPGADEAAAVLAMPEAERQAFMLGRIEALAERLQREPEDIDGWLRLARAYKVLGETDKARAAIAGAARAAERAGGNAQERVRAVATELGLS